MDSSRFSEFFRVIFHSPLVRRPYVIFLLSSFFIILAEYLLHVRWSVSPVIAYVLYWILILSSCALFSVIEFRDLRRSEDRAVVGVMTAAASVGLCVALAKLFFYHELWTVFNILAEPMRTALVALVVAWIFAARERALPRQRSF